MAYQKPQKYYDIKIGGEELGRVTKADTGRRAWRAYTASAVIENSHGLPAAFATRKAAERAVLDAYVDCEASTRAESLASAAAFAALTDETLVDEMKTRFERLRTTNAGSKTLDALLASLAEVAPGRSLEAALEVANRPFALTALCEHLGTLELSVREIQELAEHVGVDALRDLLAPQGTADEIVAYVSQAKERELLRDRAGRDAYLAAALACIICFSSAGECRL